MAKKSTVKLNFMEKITGVYLRLRSNSFYAKFLKKSNRSARRLPPITAACLAEKLSLQFLILRAPNIFFF